MQGRDSRDRTLVVSGLKPVLRRVKGAALVANLTRPDWAGVSVRVVGNWLGLGFASKLPITGTRTGKFCRRILCARSRLAQTVSEHAAVLLENAKESAIQAPDLAWPVAIF